jgi:hypothetical protein
MRKKSQEELEDKRGIAEYQERKAQRNGSVLHKRIEDKSGDNPPELIEKLSQDDREELKRREQLIDECLKELSRFGIRAGEHLIEIRDKKLWRENYSGFEDYVERRFDVDPRMGRYWICYYEDSREFLLYNLDPAKSERENRLLAPIRENKPLMVRVWRSLMKLAERPTRQQIEERVQKAVEASPTATKIGTIGSDHKEQARTNRAHSKARKKANAGDERGTNGFPRLLAHDEKLDDKNIHEITETVTMERKFHVAFPKDVPLTADVMKELSEAIEDEHKTDLVPVGHWNISQTIVKSSDLEAKDVIDAMNYFPVDAT